MMLDVRLWACLHLPIQLEASERDETRACGGNSLVRGVRAALSSAPEDL